MTRCRLSRLFCNCALTTAAVVIPLVAGGQARAALLAYEGFDYENADDSALFEKEGGSGWSTAWIGALPNDDSSIFHVSQDDVSLGSTEFPFEPVGDRVIGTGPTSSTAGSGNRITRRFAPENVLDLAQDGVMYASVLLRKSGQYPTPGSMNNVEFGIGWEDATNDVFRFGASSTNEFLFNGNGTNIIAGEVAQDTTYFLVMKIEASATADDVISGMIFGPTDPVPVAEPLTWDRTQSVDRTDIVDRVRLWVGNFGTGEFDEIRIGQSWADVAGGTTAVAGDFNGDGNVDGADFVIWQTNFPNNSGGATLASGDANGDGNVDGADFVVWQTNFPFTSTQSASPVPEPHSWLLGVLGLLLLSPRRFRFLMSWRTSKC